MTGPFDGIELPRVAVTSYGVKLRLPIHEADGITIAVILCQDRGRHCGLFLRRDRHGKDPMRPRYIIGCIYTQPDKGSHSPFVARMADLGDDLYNHTFNGKPVKASWRTIYLVPTPPDSDLGPTTMPNLIINCNPASKFRVPRWLIARFIALQFRMWQLRDTETLQVLEFFHYSMAHIYVSLGSCTEHDDGCHNTHPRLWAKVDVLAATVDLNTFTHNCSKDHLDSKSWATRSRVFGDANRAMRLSFTPSTRMLDSVLVVHLELFGRVFEERVEDPGARLSRIFPPLADIERDTPRPTPSDPITSSRPQPSSLQITSVASQRSSPSSTSTPHTWPPSMGPPREPVPNRRPDRSPPAALVDPLRGGVGMRFPLYYLAGSPPPDHWRSSYPPPPHWHGLLPSPPQGSWTNTGRHEARPFRAERDAHHSGQSESESGGLGRGRITR